jgi:uncharacterized protein DUF6527
MAGIGRLPWWEWIPGRSWRVVAIVDAADEVPRRLPRSGAILVGSPERPKWLVFDCPCKTGHRIMITLDRAHHPFWTVHDHKKLTVSPSVDYFSSDRQCHYFIRRGKIIWVKEERHNGRKRKPTRRHRFRLR